MCGTDYLVRRFGRDDCTTARGQGRALRAIMDERRQRYGISTSTKVLSLVSPGAERQTRYPKLWKPPRGTNSGPECLAYSKEVAFNRCSRELTADRYDTGVFDVANCWAKPDSTHPRNRLLVQSFWRRRVLPHRMVGSAGPLEQRRKGGLTQSAYIWRIGRRSSTGSNGDLGNRTMLSTGRSTRSSTRHGHSITGCPPWCHGWWRIRAAIQPVLAPLFPEGWSRRFPTSPWEHAPPRTGP